MDIEKLQRFLVYVLRHHPEELGFSLGEDGFVGIDTMLEALSKHKTYSWVTKQDILLTVERQKDKKRLQIEGEKIRARYGHSTKNIEEIHYPAVKPPPFLYHGTAQENMASILEKGLLPISRKYVHLSDTKEIAQRVGRRHSRDIHLFIVLCEEAERAGIEFYHPEPQIWLAEKIPPQFLKISEV